MVTGAASGIGKATTEMLVDLGAKVYALDHNDITTPGIANFVKVDLGEKTDIDAAFTNLPSGSTGSSELPAFRVSRPIITRR